MAAELKSFLPPASATPAAESTPAPAAPPETPAVIAVPEGKPTKAPKAPRAKKFVKAPTEAEVKTHEAEGKADLDKIMESLISDHDNEPTATVAEQFTDETPVEEPVVEQKPVATPAKASKTLINLAVKLGLPEAAVSSMSDEQLSPIVEAMYEKHLASAQQKPAEQPRQPEPEAQPTIDPEFMFDAQWIEENNVPEAMLRPNLRMAETLTQQKREIAELKQMILQAEGRRNYDTVNQSFAKLDAPLQKLFGDQTPRPGTGEHKRRSIILADLHKDPIPGNLPLHQQIAIRASQLWQVPAPATPPPPADPVAQELTKRRKQWEEAPLANPASTSPNANDEVSRGMAELNRLWNQEFRTA